MERMGSLSLLSRLTDKLAQKIPEHMAAMRTLVKEKRAEELAQEAHRLKGAVANFEAREVTEAVRTLEEAAREGNLEQAATQVEPLQQKLHDLLGELEAIARGC